MVLRPSPNATYLRGFAQLLPDDILVLYTDGITECHHHRTARSFGRRTPLRLGPGTRTARQAKSWQTVFQAVSRYAATSIPEDDQTLVIVKPAFVRHHDRLAWTIHEGSAANADLEARQA